MAVRIHYIVNPTAPRWQAPPELISASSMVERVPMWVIYDHPADYPEGVVARLWYSLPQPQATLFAIGANSRYEVEQAIPGFRENRWVWMERSVEDDECILGVYV